MRRKKRGLWESEARGSGAATKLLTLICHSQGSKVRIQLGGGQGQGGGTRAFEPYAISPVASDEGSGRGGPQVCPLFAGPCRDPPLGLGYGDAALCGWIRLAIRSPRAPIFTFGRWDNGRRSREREAAFVHLQRAEKRRILS